MDQGQTVIWRQVLSVILREVIPDMTFVADSWIKTLHPFYQDMLRAYVRVNILYQDVPSENLPPQNIWACKENKMLNWPLIKAGFVEVGDFPWKNGSLDSEALQ